MSATLTELFVTTGTWVIDPTHSALGFSAKHAMVTTVRGGFGDFEGTLVLDGAAPANSSATVTIQAASFTSGNEQRDGHVKGNDFLAVDNFPTLTFASTAIRQDGSDFFAVGDLTIHGVTKSVEIAAEFTGVSKDPFGNDRIGFEGTTTFNRKDFGLEWNVALEAGGFLVSDKIKITLDISAIKQA